MIVWGGDDENGDELNTGGRYNPDSDVWTAISTTGAPEARETQTAVWTGDEMIVWGGQDSFNDFNTGGRYDPSTDTWTPTSITNVPDARYNHTAVWTGNEMIIWGGTNTGVTNTGGRYDPNMDSWAATSITNAPEPRQYHTAVWTGNEMIVWGGDNLDFNPFSSGGRYCAPTPTPGCTVTSTTCGRIIVGTAPTDFTVNLSDPADPATVQASDFTVNGTPADNDIIINGALTITFHFNTSPVVGGQNTMHIPAGAFNCGQGPVQEFTCTLFYRVPGATPPPRPRPTPHPRPTPP
jgi:N-acetylneuraminic acid mutarotase